MFASHPKNLGKLGFRGTPRTQTRYICFANTIYAHCVRVRYISFREIRYDPLRGSCISTLQTQLSLLTISTAGWWARSHRGCSACLRSRRSRFPRRNRKAPGSPIRKLRAGPQCRSSRDNRRSRTGEGISTNAPRRQAAFERIRCLPPPLSLQPTAGRLHHPVHDTGTYWSEGAIRVSILWGIV